MYHIKKDEVCHSVFLTAHLHYHMLDRHLVVLSFSPPGLVSLFSVIDPDNEFAIRATQHFFIHHDRYLAYSA